MKEAVLRDGEVKVKLPPRISAGLHYIGTIRTPWAYDAPRQGHQDGPLCRIEIFEPWRQGLKDIARYEFLEVLYWMDMSRRDIVQQSPADNGIATGVFALRSPIRPNPIATCVVKVETVTATMLMVRGLDCFDGTPLLDIKPERSIFAPPVIGARRRHEQGTVDVTVPDDPPEPSIGKAGLPRPIRLPEAD